MQTDRMRKIKTVDLDGAFDKRVAEYFSKKKNKYTEEEWEDLVVELYKKFGDTKIESLNATPNEYYVNMSDDELYCAVLARFERNVPIDGFLRSALDDEKRIPLLKRFLQEDDAIALFAVEILGEKREAYPLYFPLLTRENAEELQILLADIFKEDADYVCDELLELYNQGMACETVAEILSFCQQPREEVFFLLLDEFLKSKTQVEAAVLRLARYGDERALPYIKERASRLDTGYLQWRSMRTAAESFGETLLERDFSSDEEYLLFTQEQARQREECEKVLEKE